MDFSWKIVIDAGIISTALLLATFLRSKLRVLQRFMVPNALTAGFLLLPVYNYLMPAIGYSNHRLGDLVYHLLSISFIAMTLRSRPKKAKGDKRGSIWAMSTAIISQYAIQAFMGLILTWILLSTVAPGLNPAFGLTLPLGFAMGPGQAYAIGKGWESMGFEGAGTVGLTMAALGYLWACLVGVALVNIGVRKGFLPDATLATLFDIVWRPDYFDTMVASGLLDLGAYQPRFGLFTDPLRKQIRVERPEFSKVYRYDSISAKDDGSYLIAPGGASFRFAKSGSLVFTPAKADLSPDLPPEAPRSFEFVRHDKDIQAVVAAEERRRLSRLADFVSTGERYESDAYGVLIITRSARFTWVANGALTPGYIPEGSGDTGSVAMDLYLSADLAAEWDGAFTLRFDALPRSPVSFAYRTVDDELFLAYLPHDSIRGAVVTAPDGLEPVAALDRYR